MITSYETGAKFVLVNEASATLSKLAEQFERFDAQIKGTAQLLKDFDAQVLALPGSFAAAAGRIATEWARVDSALGGAITQVGTLKADLAALSIPRGINSRLTTMERRLTAINTQSATAAGNLARMAVPAIPVGGGATPGGVPPVSGRERRLGGRGGGQTPGMVVHSPGVPLGGGFHVRGHGMGGLASMGILGALGLGIYEEAEVEDIIARGMLTGQLQVDENMRQTDAFGRFRDIIKRVSGTTGFGPRIVGESMLTTERQFAGLPFEKRLSLQEQLFPFAASEARMKEGATLPEAFEALVGLTHMTGTYDEKKIPELMRQFQYASMITPVGIKQFESALSYSLPMLKAGLGMDSSSAMFLTAMTETAGIQSTKAGTWIRSFFENAEPHLGGARGDDAKNDALRKMGMIDSGLNVKWQVKRADGSVDWDASVIKMSEIMNKFLSSSDEATRLSTLRTAFGERGGGFGALMNLPEFIAQFPKLQEQMRRFKGGEDVITSLDAASPVQKARVTWAKFESSMMDFGIRAMPLLESVLQKLNVLLDTFLKLPKESQDRLLNTALGEVVGNFFGGTPGALAGATIGDWLSPAGEDGRGDLTIFGSLNPMNLLRQAGRVWDALGLPSFSWPHGDPKAPGIEWPQGKEGLNLFGIHAMPASLGGFDGPTLGGVSSADDAIYNGVYRALVDWSSLGGSMGGGGGGGFGGFGGRYGHGAGGGSRLRGGVGPTNIGWSAGGSTPQERAAFIRHTAASLGIDPDIALRVAQSEGFYKFTGDHGMSHGDFQLYDGGGLGNIARKAGINPADPSQWKAADEFALKYAARNGWGAWHGAAHVGIGNRQGIGSYHGAVPPLASAGIGTEAGRLAYLAHLATAPGRSPNLAGVDARLRDILAAAGGHLPEGYRALVTEGYNPGGHVGGSQHHVWGKGALDMLIMGPNGPISNRGSDPTGLYTHLARSAYGEMLARYPELKGQFAWGGSFGTGRGSSTRDLMHFDIGGERGGLGPWMSSMGPLTGERYGRVPSPPSAKDMRQREHEALEIHLHSYLDGEKVSHVVTKHQTKHGWAPTRAPYHDSYGHATSPDIGFETG